MPPILFPNKSDKKSCYYIMLFLTYPSPISLPNLRILILWEELSKTKKMLPNTKPTKMYICYSKSLRPSLSVTTHIKNPYYYYSFFKYLLNTAKTKSNKYHKAKSQLFRKTIPNLYNLKYKREILFIYSRICLIASKLLLTILLTQ